MRALSFYAGAIAAGAAVLLLPAAAMAQAGPQVSDSGAQEIRQALKRWIAEQVQGTEGVDLTFDGAIEVIPQGDRYEAVIPAATVGFDGDAATMALDPIPITLTPLDNGWFNARWTLPTEYIIEETRTGDTTTLTIGGQSGSGVFAPEYQTFMTLDVTLDDLLLLPPREQGSLTMDTLVITTESEETADGVYDSVSAARIADWEIIDAGTRVLHAEALAFEFAGAGLRLADLLHFAEAMAALDQEHGAGAGGEPQPAFYQSLATLIEDTPTLADGLTLGYDATGLEIDADGTQVRFGDAAIGLFLDGLAGDASRLGLNIGFTALDIQPLPEHARLVPSEATIQVAAVGLPNAALVGMLRDFALVSAESGPDAAMFMAMGSLQEAITAAGSRVEIARVDLVADVASLDLSGTITPDPQAALGITAQGAMVIENLDTLINELKALPDTRDVVQALTLVQAVGERPADDRDAAVRHYDLELTPAGVFLLNGTDMGPLLETLGE